MKEKDNGISGLQLKISENNAPPIEIESKFPSNDKITEKSEGIANKKSEDQNQIIKDQNQKNIQQNEDIDLLVEKNQLKDNKIKKLSDNEKNKEIKTDKNQLKVKNGIMPSTSVTASGITVPVYRNAAVVSALSSLFPPGVGFTG